MFQYHQSGKPISQHIHLMNHGNWEIGKGIISAKIEQIRPNCIPSVSKNLVSWIFRRQSWFVYKQCPAMHWSKLNQSLRILSLSLMLSPSFFTEIAALLSAYLGSSLKRQQWGNTVISVVGLILFSSSGIVVPVSDFLCKSITIQNNQEITSKESIDDGKGLDVCNQHG